FPANAALLGVKHLATPPEVLRTLAKAKIVNGGRKGKAGKAGGPSNIVLDLTIDAPSKIFVRGRGLDTELGGELKLTGPISNVSPV
ncbi:translocation/assembly module TamB domain-containing protein, partial [Salmonella enterica]